MAIITILVGLGIMITILGGFVGNNTPPLVGLVGLVFVIIGGLILMSARSMDTVMQRGGNITITATRVIGKNTQQQSIPITDVAAVRLVTYLQSTSSSTNSSDGFSISSGAAGQSRRRSELSLLLKNNDLVELASSDSSGGSFSVGGMNLSQLVQKAPLSNEAAEIANFLGVELQADDNSSVASAVKSVFNAFKSATDEAQPTQVANIAPANPAPPVTQSIAPTSFTPQAPTLPAPAPPESPLPTKLPMQ